MYNCISETRICMNICIFLFYIFFKIFYPNPNFLTNFRTVEHLHDGVTHSSYQHALRSTFVCKIFCTAPGNLEILELWHLPFKAWDSLKNQGFFHRNLEISLTYSDGSPPILILRIVWFLGIIFSRLNSHIFRVIL